MSDDAQDGHLSIEIAFDQFDVGRFGRNLSEGGIHRYPFRGPAQLYFWPSVVIKLSLRSYALRKHHPSSDARGNPRGACKADKECRVFIAVAPHTVQHFEPIGNADTRLLSDLGEHPVCELLLRFETDVSTRGSRPRECKNRISGLK